MISENVDFNRMNEEMNNHQERSSEVRRPEVRRPEERIIQEPTRKDSYRFVLIHRSNLFPVYKDVLKKYTITLEEAKASCASSFHNQFDKYAKDVEQEKKKLFASAWYIIHEDKFEELRRTDKTFSS